MVQVHELDIEWEDRYEAFVKSLPHGLLYHSIKYKNFLDKIIPSGRPIYLIATVEHRVVAALPCFSISTARGTVFNSLPFFGSHGGVLVSGELPSPNEIIEKLVSILIAKARECGAISLTVVTSPFDELSSLTKEFDHDCEDDRVGQFVILPDSGSQSSMMGLIHSKTRNMVRKAEGAHFKISRRHDDHAWNFLAKTHFENLSEIGGNPKEKYVFEALSDVFQPQSEYDIWIAEANGELAAGLLVFYYNGIAEYFTPCVVPSHRSSQPLSLLVFNAMTYASSIGCKVWNWGGTWLTQAGVRQFKSRWGTQEKMYKYYTWIFDQTIKNMPKSEVLENFKYFYVLPFSELVDAMPSQSIKSTNEESKL